MSAFPLRFGPASLFLFSSPFSLFGSRLHLSVAHDAFGAIPRLDLGLLGGYQRLRTAEAFLQPNVGQG
jgi:hypothetical protein